MSNVAPLLAALTIAASIGSAWAQDDWPQSPVTLVVPFQAGGITDIVARRLEPGLSADLGQNVVIMNVGGHSSVGTRRVIDAQPDGSEFLVHETGLMTGQASGVMDFGYRDLKPVAALENLCLVMLTRSDSGWKSVAEIAAGSEERELIAGVNMGGLSHMAAVAAAELGGFKIRPVQIGGSADAYAALLGKQIDLMFSSPADAMSYTRGDDGGPRPDADAIAALYFGSERFEGLAEVEAVSDLGSDASICAPHMIFAPLETPDAIVERMADAVEAAYGDGELRSFMAKVGSTELFVRGDELPAFLDSQWESLAPLAERAKTVN